MGLVDCARLDGKKRAGMAVAGPPAMSKGAAATAEAAGDPETGGVLWRDGDGSNAGAGNNGPACVPSTGEAVGVVPWGGDGAAGTGTAVAPVPRPRKCSPTPCQKRTCAVCTEDQKCM